MLDNGNNEESIISHIEALRTTLIRCFSALAIVLPFTFYMSPRVLNFLIKILLGNNEVKLNYFAPMEVFILQIKLALLIDIIVCFPYIMKKIWDFVLPALYEKEKQFIKSSVIISSILFVFGVLFCIFTILPLVINFGMSFAGNNIQAVFGISNVINMALWLGFVFGLMFQVPLIVYLLIKWDIVEYETISSIRPYVLVCLLVLSALLTPPDIISQILLFSPTYILFELGLCFSKLTCRSKKSESVDE